MSFFKSKLNSPSNKQLLTNENEELKNENLNLQKQGFQQAQEMGAEIMHLTDEIDSLKTQLTEQQSQAQLKLVETEVESELLLLQLHQTQEELEILFLQEQDAQKKLQDLSHQNEALLSQKTQLLEQDSHAQLNIDEYKSESELLLLQLHQTQEELEILFLQEQEAQKQLQDLKNHNQILLTEKHTLTNEVSDKQQLTQNLEALVKNKALVSKELASQVEMTLANEAKITKLLEELEAKQHVQQANSQLQVELSQLSADNDKLSREQQALQTELLQNTTQLHEFTVVNDSMSTDLEKQRQLSIDRAAQLAGLNQQIDIQLKDAQEEYELLLLQLHQVQEELEHYFLEHDKFLRENQAYQKRWLRLEDRFPQYLDYGSIVPISVNTVSEIPCIVWRATDITICGILMPAFNFATILQEGSAGLKLLDELDALGSLLPVQLIPRVLIQANAQDAIAQFRQLTSLQWRQINVALNAIQLFFKAPEKALSGQALPDYFDVVFWRQAILPLIADVAALPTIFRFNQITLKRELINSDYEHLWLVFHDAVYGQYSWPKFELRLGAAMLRPGSFTKFPKLEFPRINGNLAPFDSWYVESYDDFGDKLELRFDLNKQLFDVAVWSQLSVVDQTMMFSLMNSLGVALKRLEQERVPISRPWSDWTDLVTAMITTMSMRLTQLRAINNPPPSEIEVIEVVPEVVEVKNAVLNKQLTKTPMPTQKRSKRNRRR